MGGADPVASSTSSYVPNGTILHVPLAGMLAFELFVERERGALGAVMNVSCPSSTSAELGAGLWKTNFEVRGGTASSAPLAGLWGFVEVARATTTGVCVFGDGWVMVCELVWHASVCGVKCRWRKKSR